jgi:amidase
MRFEEYRQHDATSLAELIAKREVSVEEVLETAIARAEQVNPVINAIVHKQYEQARKAVVRLPEGPLKGVPFLIKDLAFSRRVSRRPSAAACSSILSPITRLPMSHVARGQASCSSAAARALNSA